MSPHFSLIVSVVRAIHCRFFHEAYSFKESSADYSLHKFFLSSSAADFTGTLIVVVHFSGQVGLNPSFWPMIYQRHVGADSVVR